MSLVNVSEGASLALHSMALIAGREAERMTVKALAEELDASQAHLAKVFQKLGKAGLVNSVRGPSGGIELGRPAQEISFLDIYEAIEGRVVLGGCPLNRSHCAFEECIFSDELNRISNDIYETLEKTVLSDYR